MPNIFIIIIIYFLRLENSSNLEKGEATTDLQLCAKTEKNDFLFLFL